MAAVLKSAAVSSSNKGQPSSFYSKDKPNPVFQALDQEFKKFAGYMKKRAGPGYKKPEEESYSRPADTLFELWNKYEARLPTVYYQKKLLEMGDFLVTIKEYKLALWQCYERYLQAFGDVNVEEITNVDMFRNNFFPNGFDGENAGLTFRALMGKSISMYQVVKLSDPKLQNKQSVDRCVQILIFLRLVMQVVLPKESLCWLVYNGTVHIYSMSRHLMSLGHSARVLEFLLWASMCMETSVPLLAVKYLPWRTTLYTAVCQCYYDCKAGQHAEGFARRGLAKINELSKLEGLSSSQETPESEIAFREATVKMAVMVYKRSVMETRRKPKGLLRPKTRANLKDVLNLPWPRTPSEKMLADMFEGSAAQMLAVLESLQDTNRRILLTSAPAPDNEPEILDVFCELFMAAQEILAGGGGHKPPGPKPMSSLGGHPLASVVTDRRLIEMATKGEDGVPISAVIKLVKLAFNYEHWDTFDLLVDPLLTQLKVLSEDRYMWDGKALELLQVMERLNSSNRRHKRMVNVTEEEKEEEPASGAANPPPSTVPGTSVKAFGIQDDLINLAEVLLSIVSGPFLQENIEIDMIVDAGLFLWNKCKVVFQKFQTGSVDNPRYLHKMENPNKWMFLLDAVHQVLCWSGISSVDPALTAEVVLRLALVYESSAHLEAMEGRSQRYSRNERGTAQGTDAFAETSSITPRDHRSGLKDSKTTLTDVGTAADTNITGQQYLSRASMLSSTANITARGQLLQAREILELGLHNVSFARQAVVLNDGKSIADVSFIKSVLNAPGSVDLNPEVFSVESVKEVSELSDDSHVNVEELIPPSHRGAATAVWNTVKDLHLELILMYHRVCLKLSSLGTDPSLKESKSSKRRTGSDYVHSDGSMLDSYVESFDELSSRCSKNSLSKALLYMQHAQMSCNDGIPSQHVKKLFEESVSLIQRAEAEERRLYLDNKSLCEMSPRTTKIPPPPILLCRTDNFMVFTPAPFDPHGGEKVAWYRLFGRSASGSNVKVRINDYFLDGTGEEVPSFRCELKAAGLKPNERYVFAVGAYTCDGKLIGESVGETSKPILASHPLPVLMTWAFLTQIAYQVGGYDISRHACDVLWDHFLAEKPPPQGTTYTTSVNKDYRLTLLRLNQRAVCLSSPVLLRQFLTAIFISVDISVRNGQLFCDGLCDRGPLYTGQIRRLSECEKMLVAIELAGWLNEANLALQAVVQCYGLLAPLLFYKIPSLAVIQVLQRCHAVLQEIPAGLIQKRQGNIADSLHHMTACITFHMAKVLRTWGQKALASSINESGRLLLATEMPEEKPSKVDGGDADKGETTGVATENTDVGSITLQAMKKKPKKRTGQSTFNKEETDGPVNEELKALTAHILSLTKASHNEHELTGNEDPSILHAYIAYLPSKMAYREVMKFKRRARYLEFLVHVAQKGLTEGLAEQVVDWCEDSINWLSKRNEQILGNRMFMSKQPGVITIGGDDPKKFAAAMVEYSKDKDTTPRGTVKQPTAPGKPGGRPKKKTKYKPIGITPHMTDAARHAQEEAELKALEKLSLYLPDAYRTANRRRRMRKISTDELPWRTQLSIVQGLSHFGAFLQKLEKREKVLGSTSSSMYKTSFLDQEWFTFETAGTLVVGWEGGPARQTSAVGLAASPRKIDEPVSALNALDLAVDQDRPKTTGIEFAAAAATGAPPPPLYTIPPEAEDTPRTYRSEQVSSRYEHKHHIDPDTSPLSTRATVEALNKTFTYFKHAVTLAHRGQHWTLLQNAARALWNCAHTALLRAFTANQGGQDAGLLTIDVLRSLVWSPLHMAAECLLDMMVHLQVDLDHQSFKAKAKGRKAGTYFESWYGDVKNEKGGASQKFEPPLDDMSIVDVRFIRRLVLRVLEMLYYEQKWEKLTDIALRFSALSNDRYAEQVIPLLVQAQRKLDQRITKLGGVAPPQPHFRKLMAQLGGVIKAKDYLKAQLRIEINKSNVQQFEPGSQIDPMGHNVHSSEDSQRLVSVPVDANSSLTTLRHTLDAAHYTARALHHSRKLLVLYLGGQMNASEAPLSKSPSKVEFMPNTAHPQPTMAPDLSQEDFLSVSDIQTSPVPRSQLGTVISSYEKTIDMLMAKNQKGLASQAMRELGNVLYHTGNIRGAYRCWSDSLDIVLNTTDTLHSWRELLQGPDDISQELLKRCGLWGCVQGGILASNMAQYVLTSDLGLQMECCFLSGFFFKGLFRSSLPHPTADRDYAMYEVGEGCEVTNLVPGVDFLSDRFRCDGRQLVSALRWVTEELSRGKHNLFVLPLLTLYQYFTTFVCRDLQRTVDGRILKVRILTDLSLYTEAFITLQRLLHGERLPHTGDSNFRQVESRMSSIRFNTAKPLTDRVNLRVIEAVLDKRLSSSLGTLYGPHMTCHLSIVQAHLFVTIANTIPVLPAAEDVILLEGQVYMKPRTISTISRGGLGSRGPKLSQYSMRSPHDSPRDVDEDSDETVGGCSRRFTESKKSMTVDAVKGTLLSVAEKMVSTISEVIVENAENDKAGLSSLSAAELELVVLCKLEQAAIARQKHHAPLAARIVLSALKMLQNSGLFQAKKDTPPPPRPSSMKGRHSGSRRLPPMENIKLTDSDNTQFQYQNFQSRSRLDTRLWLHCRLALVSSLIMEVRGMGDVKGSENKVLTDVAECRQYCAEGLSEAEACGDVEMQAEFLAQGAQLNIIEGKNLEHTVLLMEDAIKLLSGMSCLSNHGERLLVLCLLMKTDLEAACRKDVDSDAVTQKTLNSYLDVHRLVLSQMEQLGERIEHYHPMGQQEHLATPVSPMDNIYLPNCLRLSQVKLRIGHAMARNTAKQIRNGVVDVEYHHLWAEALGVLSTALEISQVSVTREANLEAEILFNMGKVQKMLAQLGKFQPRAAANTLIEAIKTSFATDHDLGLIRQSYLEIALIYMCSSGVVVAREGSFLELAVGDSGDEGKPSSSHSQVQKKKLKSKKERSKSRSKEDDPSIPEHEREKRAAWLAIRCAAATAAAQRARMLLIGDNSVTSQKLGDKEVKNVPEFAALDLISCYVLGEKKKIFKSEIEEELSSLMDAQEVKQVDTYDDQVNKARTGAKDLSWIHFLGYQTVLQRLCSTATICATSSQTDTVNVNGGDLGPDFDLGFISHAQFDTTMNHDVVRSMLFSGPWSCRLRHMHGYLTSYLPVYASDCCAIYPPSSLLLPVPSTSTDLNITMKTYTSNLSLGSSVEMENIYNSSLYLDPRPLPPGTQANPHKPVDEAIVNHGDNELVLQWHQPTLDESDPAHTEMGSLDRRIILLYALSRKGSSGSPGVAPGFLWVSQPQLIDLHDRLAVLAQRGEISLTEKDKTKKDKDVTPATPTPAKPKKTQRIKALSPKPQRDEQLEGLLRQCLDDCTLLLASPPEQDAVTEIPFDVNRSNIKNLEQLFDQSFGLMLRGTDVATWIMKMLS
ncbi:cilia- and flagella-associated protein 54-like isoform X2 [Haliotis rufescens]|uniref:cilia- and flagella-associated protein 54-like isoform X2 n=1 Tax=Haliotis rufescens TaxID=6454 RepID=UPI00201E7CC3|nr:cilia- and flagella-associated protein 54-like isoform X2 [Haliotis rufescens]